MQYENDSEEQYLVKSKIWFQEQDVKTLLNKMLVFRIVLQNFFFQTSMFLVTLDFLGFKISFIWFLMAQRYLDCIPSF